MFWRLPGLGAALCFCVTLCSAQVGAQGTPLPKLGDPVPSCILKARLHSELCATAASHRDPCASLKIKGFLFTVAWDANTAATTYLFTKDPHVITDSELGVNGSCRVVDQAGRPYQMTQYLDWLVTPRWADAIRDLSGDATWYATLAKNPKEPGYRRIEGFVQRRYLNEKLAADVQVRQ